MYKRPYNDFDKITHTARVVIAPCSLRLSKYPIRTQVG